MAEIWELVNIHKEKNGLLYTRGSGDPIPEGSYHLYTAVWVRNAAGRLLLTQRSPGKDCGLMWECTGGCAVQGETGPAAACRELSEEVGIDAKPGDLQYLGDTVGKSFIAENYLLQTEKDPAICFRDGEVVDAKWVAPQDMDRQKAIMVPAVWNRFEQFRDKLIPR